MLPGLSVKVFPSYRHSTATFHPLQYPDWNDSYTVLLRYVCVWSPGGNMKYEINKCIQASTWINSDSRLTMVG